MNNDNALMLEALAKSRSPKQVLREGDEFEDDFVSPGINVFIKMEKLYTVEFFPEPGNPKGIITYGAGLHAFRKSHGRKTNKAKFWKMERLPSYVRAREIPPAQRENLPRLPRDIQPHTGAFLQDIRSWMFNWTYYGWAEGFIEGEDFIFVERK